MNKELIKKYFECGDFPTEEDFAELIDSSLGVLDSMGELPDANETTLGTEYKVGDNYVKCVFESGSYSWKTIGAVVPTSNYEDLENKPAIDGKILSKSTKSSDLDLISLKGNYQSIKPNTEDFVYIFKNGSVFYSKVSDLLNSSDFQEVIELETMTSTAPPITDAIEGKTKYYNTGESKIYVATSETSWSEEGEIPTDEKLYINKSNNSLYRYNGAMLAIGGGGVGGGHSIVDKDNAVLPQRSKLKFDATVTDNESEDITIVEVKDGVTYEWLTGTADPNSSLGKQGDMYLRTSNYDVFKKTSSTSWTLQGNIKGVDGKGIASSSITYQQGSSGTTPPTGTWDTTIPTVTKGNYLWTMVVLTYTDNTTSTAYAVAYSGLDGGGSGLPVGATFGDILYTNKDNNAIWLKGRANSQEDELFLSAYTRDVTVNLSSQTEITIQFDYFNNYLLSGSVPDIMEAMNVLIDNTENDNDVIVEVHPSQIIWNTEGDIVVPANGVIELSIKPFLDGGGLLKLRGIYA